MAEVGGFNVLALLAVLLAAVGCLLHLVGLSVVYWIVSYPFVNGSGVGLWQTCSVFGCRSYSGTPDFWKASQAFVIIGLFLGVAGLALSIVSLIINKKLLRLLGAVACMLAAGCILLAVIIFGSETRIQQRTQWGWGFILDIVSAFFFIPAGILNFIQYRQSS